MQLKRKVLIIFLTLLFIPAFFIFGQELHMLYMAQAGYQPSDIIQRAESFYRETGIKVRLKFVEYEDQYNLIIKSSQKSSADYDIILLDLIWTADFAEKKIIVPVPLQIERIVKKGIVPEIYQAFEYSGKLWAMPFLANFQLFYTNMALLKKAGFTNPPSTLEEVVHMARVAKTKGLIKYPWFDSLRKQEALVCEYVWLVGAFGGDLVNAKGNIDVTTPPNIHALEFLVNLLKMGIINPYSLHSEEVFAAEVFIQGDCLFTTNWTFLTGLIKKSTLPISNARRVSLIPVSKIYNSNKNDTSTKNNTSTVSGFQGLSVTRNSSNKTKAWKFIRYLSSPEFQKMHLSEMSVWKNVWNEKETALKDPEITIKKQQIFGVHNRPIHPQYRQISKILQKWIYNALCMKISPHAALHRAQEEIDHTIEGE